ncbi:hypothetical protein LTR10_023257 [Elasticomyces elasticus]|uniref:Uncharacterized protein n=1 Tax=Exophiala sideris TaxID=1016849 RepID=A0ABR0J3V6_9EURO|nr:hypothetical protein LTR10_023257 [Elasticomyces elasticus]KAK5024749.1 hypothetical protein LTS07_008595 [Exophiala sideris]KAK5030842.1 hypothetical protein LTR13_008196 [Exophiala sideris]KAK5054384.1 hypothetical protein LTR69_008999 [Exophiala sideris]KAK5179784.1 hypothetical protein LTR44_007952 [Eurotiomycetes sp. CCFEE 6388]
MKPTLDLSAMLLMIVIWCILIPLCLASSSNASTTSSDLKRRQCVFNATSSLWDCDLLLPTLEQMITRFRDTGHGGGAIPENIVWFYTNFDAGSPTYNFVQLFGWIHAWFDGQGLQSYYIYDGIDQAWRRVQENHIFQNANEIAEHNRDDYPGWDTPHATFWWCFFEAAASAALAPDAVVFTPHNTPWNPDRIWALVEMPALTRNPNIQRIYRVDPRPGAGGCGEEELVWDRGRGDLMLASTWRCPV